MFNFIIYSLTFFEFVCDLLHQFTNFFSFRWFDAQPHKVKVCIAGNHDFILDPAFLESVGGDVNDVQQLLV